MIMRLKKYILVVILLPLLFGKVVYAAQTGGTGLNFLKIGVGPRAIGMGEAFVAVSDDASAFYWNPAGLSQIDRCELSGMYASWLGGMNFGFLSYVSTLGETGAFGVSITNLSSFDIQGYDDTGAKIGTINVSDTAVAFTYSREIMINRNKNKAFHFGGNVKYIAQKLHIDSAVVYAFDLGALYRLSGDRFNVGFSAQNIGGNVQLSNTGYPMPLNYRLGLASRILGDDILLALDFNLPNDNSVSMNAGFEYRFNNLFTLRAGYKLKPSNVIDEGLRCGLGFVSEMIDVDYAYVPYGFLGQTHRFSVSYRFGERFNRGLIIGKIEKYFLKGKRYYRKKDFVRANKMFNDVLMLDPKHEAAGEYQELINAKVKDLKVETYLEKGNRYLEENKILKAKEEFENILSLFPDHPQAKDSLEKLKDKIVVEKEKMADIMFEDGLEYYKKKKYAEAVVLWQKVLSVKPGHKESRDFIAMAETKLEEIKKEMELKQIALDYREADNLYEKALKYYEKKKLEVAFNSLKAAIRLNSKHEKGIVLIKKVKEAMSERFLSEGLELFEKGSVEDSVKKLEKALELNPANNQAAEYLKKAEQNMETANQQKADELNKKALLKYSDGSIEEAIELWEEALKLCPDHVSSRKNMERVMEERNKE